MKFLASLSILLVSVSASKAAVLAYEGFDTSVSGAGDTYQQDASINGASDARTGFSGSWGNPPTAAGIDYETRATNMSYANFKTGDSGAFEIYEARAGRAPTGRSNGRSLSYVTPDSDDIYFAFGWATSDGAAHSISLLGSRDILMQVSDTGDVSVNFEGATATDFSGGTAFMDGSWNLMVIRAINDPVSSNPDFYDSYQLWLNPTIASGAGDVSQLGTPDGTGDGIIREHGGGGTAVSFNSVRFGAEVGTGDEVQFDEFYITNDPGDFLVAAAPVPEPSSLTLFGVAAFGWLARRRRD